MNQQPLGFVAFWKATDRWFCAEDVYKRQREQHAHLLPLQDIDQDFLV